MVDLSIYADDYRIQYDPRGVVATIEAGSLHRCNQALGLPPEQYEADRDLMRRYCIGQAMACLSKGMAPHSVIQRFARVGASA
jgi:hypothetical protein